MPKPMSESEVLASAKRQGLMQVIERIIGRHHRGEHHLDEYTFTLYEVAKEINRAKNNKEFLAAIARL